MSQSCVQRAAAAHEEPDGIECFRLPDVLRIVETGRTSDVLGAPQNDYTRRLLSAVPRLPVFAAREQVSPRCAAKPSALPELEPLSA